MPAHAGDAGTKLLPAACECGDGVSPGCPVVAVQPVFDVAMLVSWQRVRPVQVNGAGVS